MIVTPLTSAILESETNFNQIEGGRVCLFVKQPFSPNQSTFALMDKYALTYP